MDLSFHPRPVPAPDMSPIPPMVPAPEPPRRGRCKLWDLHHKYHCPVIGTCMEVAEMRRIAARTGQRSDGPLSDFQVHLTPIGQLYAVERSLRESSSHARKAARELRSRPILEKIKAWLDEKASTVLPKGLLGTAIRLPGFSAKPGTFRRLSPPRL